MKKPKFIQFFAKPPYMFEDLRQADCDIWLKGKNGNYRKTFVTRAGYIFLGIILLIYAGLFFYLMRFPDSNPAIKIIWGLLIWPLSILFGPILFLWGYFFIKNAIEK